MLHDTVAFIFFLLSTLEIFLRPHDTLIIFVYNNNNNTNNNINTCLALVEVLDDVVVEFFFEVSVDLLLRIFGTC